VQPRLWLKIRGVDGVQKRPIYDHPFLDLMAQPNPEESGLVFLWRQLVHLQTAGRYVVKVIPEVFEIPVGGQVVRMARISRLRLLEPDRVRVLEDPRSGELVGFQYSSRRGEQETIVRAPVTADERRRWLREPHVFAFASGLPGAESRWQSPVEAGDYAVDIDQQLDRLHLRQLQFGVWSQLIFYLLKDFADPERFRQAVLLAKQGVGNAGDPLVLPEKLVRVEKSPASNSEMEFQELGHEVRRKVLAVLGAPDAIIGLGGNVGSRATVEAMEKALAIGTVDPLLALVADGYNSFLLPLYRGQSSSEWYEVDFPSAAQFDEVTQAEYLRTLVGGKPIMTQNEARSILQLKPRPEGDTLDGKGSLEAAVGELLKSAGGGAGGNGAGDRAVGDRAKVGMGFLGGLD
jgi:hypothetical protein